MAGGSPMAKPHISPLRLQTIVNTLMQEGLSVPLSRMHLTHCASWHCRWHCTLESIKGRSKSKRPWPVAVKNAMIRLGPAFVKVGQVLSVRTDLIPQALADELHSLQSEVPFEDHAQMMAVLEQELGQDPLAVFSEIDHDPLAAGSMAQIYRAKYPDGREVVLKIKRPGIDRIVQEDLDILIFMASLLDKYLPESRAYQPVKAAQE